MKGLGNIAGMMKQAQNMKKRLAEMQEELESQEVSATAGGGMITVTMNGKHKITGIKIEKEIIDPEDVSMLEDLIMLAVNEAQDRVNEMVQEKMTSITGGINIPGLTS